MKVDIGDIIEIGGKQAIVCFETIFKDENYICVAFEDKSIAYDIYKWRIQNEKLQVAKVTNYDELSNVLKVFLDESLKESDSSDEIKELFARISEKIKEGNSVYGSYC